MELAIAALPASRCGTTLEQAKDDYLAERNASLKDSTWRKHRGVLQAFIKEMGNLDVAMVNAKTVTDFKKSLLTLKRAATTINDQIGAIWRSNTPITEIFGLSHRAAIGRTSRS